MRVRLLPFVAVVVLVVEVRAGEGSDRIADRKTAARLDELLEAAAQQSLATAAPKP